MDLRQWLRAEWDRVLGFALVGLGGLLLVCGYMGVSRSAYVAQGLSYIMSGGIGGLFLLGAGATMLISADLHDEWRKLDGVEEAIRAGEAPLVCMETPTDVAPVSRPETAERSTVMVGRAAS